MSDETTPPADALVVQTATPRALEVGPYSAAMRPRNLAEAITLSEMLAKSSFVPRDCQGKPMEVLARITYGSEIGLAPLTAVHTVMTANGKPSVYGDGLLGICQAHPAYEWHNEFMEGDGDTRTAVFLVKRRGNPMPVTTRYSVAQAKQAKLWKKAGPWTDYPDRMLQMRARGFGLRDQFSDALKGVISREEAEDFPSEASRAPVRAEVIQAVPVEKNQAIKLELEESVQ